MKPFKCDHCYERTIGWDADDLLHPRSDGATQLFVSQRWPITHAFSILHTLYLRRPMVNAAGGLLDGRAYELLGLYEDAKTDVWGTVDTRGILSAEMSRQLRPHLRAYLTADVYLQYQMLTCKGYLEYKEDRFCTRAGAALSQFRPVNYTLSHLQRVSNAVAVGGKVSIHHKDFPKTWAVAGSVQYDTGAGILSLTGTTDRQLIATCTRHVAHPNTPDEENVTVAAELRVDPTNLGAAMATVGYKFRFPQSNSVLRGTVNTLYHLNCVMENDLELLNVRSFFFSRLNFVTHTYKFGLGFTMGGDLRRPRQDNNPLLRQYTPSQ
jgi:hypothetical protein